MDFDELDSLRRHDPAWRLLRADHAPLVLGFLRKVFVDDNVRSISATELTSRLDDELWERSFVGTESRLNTVFELLRQMAYGAQTDPAARLAGGDFAVLDDSAQQDRY
ncbi:DUF3375 family protein [Amycolatopsis albispora]|uniref:DUF3375 domain-containing protein n=1 Tax=Amycolatopsis albispora TaxID=1804986 RepID=A0A344LB04_9PSEU|nr:DUF3375 family protein [Amycolatopsis albispora]AXB45228.1 hypothetical protein A4R43_24255 [Amycolatopsis albispora]